MAITKQTFSEQMDRLLDVMEPGRDKGAYAGLLDEWRDLFAGLEWVSPAVFRAAVTRALAHYDRIPTTHQFQELLTVARDDERREAARAMPVLPPPQRVEAAEIDPNDPYSCTPEERERWAREDQWIRQWAARLPKALPDYAPAAEVNAWKRNLSVASWPNLTPVQRRAKERRIAAERERAFEAIRQRLGWTADEADALGIPAQPQPVQWDTTRLDALKAKQAAEDAAAQGIWPAHEPAQDDDAQDDALLRAASVTWRKGAE